jgi:hypothetical protein
VSDPAGAPVISSDGGAATATRSIAENTTAVTTVQATDPDLGTTLTYAIVPRQHQWHRFEVVI